MKYAIIGPRKAVFRIVDSETVPEPISGNVAVEISNEQETEINSMKENKEIVVYWNNIFTSRQRLAYDGIGLRFNDDTKEMEEIQVPLPPIERRLKRVFDSLPVEAKPSFLPIAAGMKWSVDNGDVNSARALLSATDVPVELQAAKDAMLAEFDK